MDKLERYKPAEVQNWSGLNSAPDQSIYPVVEMIDLRNKWYDFNDNFTLLGYCCDVGVDRGQGRPGALLGPNAIRQQLAGCANRLATGGRLFDVGNVSCLDGNLEFTQFETSRIIFELLEAHGFPIVLGGSHDLAFAHGQAIYDYMNVNMMGNQRLGILNLDAQLDLQTLVEGRGNNGTPFYQLRKICGDKRQFDYCCLGLQKRANSEELMARAKEYGVTIVVAEDCGIEAVAPWEAIFDQWLEEMDMIYLTIDLSGFAAEDAPGVSTPSPLGFSPDFARKVIQKLRARNKLISCDLVELNPKYDIDNRTAKLAAGLITDLIYAA